MAMMRRATSTVETTVDEADGEMKMSSLNALGCTPPMMFNPGYSIDSLPPVTCTNTTAPLLTIPATRSQGWLALHLVNAAATSKLQVSLDAHTMFVFAADGLYVEMQEVKVGALPPAYVVRTNRDRRCSQSLLANAIRL